MKIKKLTAILLVLAMAFTLAACGGGKSTSTPAPTAPAQQTPAPTQSSGSSSGYKLDWKGFTITLAHDNSTTHPAYKYAEYFKTLVEEMSNGLITVNVFGGGQLSNGNPNQTVQLLQDGQVNMAIINGLSTPEWDVWKLPFLVSTLEEARTVMEGKGGQYMLDSLKDNGILGISYMDVGFRVFSAPRSLANVADAANLKVRIVNSVAFTAFIEALKAYPVTVSIGELYTALQQGQADAQENPITTIYGRAFYEVNKYITLTNHIWTYYIWAANLDWFESLPAEAQDIILKCSRKMIEEYNVAVAEQEQEMLQAMKNAGAVIVELTEDQRKAWAEVGRSTHAKLVKDIGVDIVALFYEDLGLEPNW